MKHQIIVGESLNPWENLALEELIFSRHQEGAILYLWQNQNTVVIGKNQNAWRECRLEALEKDGGKLARRSSGGGAVFHDIGNLNFTFIGDNQLYDVQRQLDVIKKAVLKFGIKAEFSGRNDLILSEGGEKFSGNAFWVTREKSLHHGTILIHVDMEKLGKYLAPPKEKLESKGIKSVRSRVCNLKERAPEITVDAVRQALKEAFIEEYGEAELVSPEAFQGQDLDKLVEKYSSWEWRAGRSPNFDVSLEKRFPWGSVELQAALKGGKIQDAAAYSDSMDEAIGEKLKGALLGCPFVTEEMARRIGALDGREYQDIAAWILATEW